MKKIAEFYKSLGDQTRLKILQMLSGQEMCVCEIIDRLEMSQPAVSHHLKILRQAGLVSDSRDGKWIYYSLKGSVFEDVFQGEDIEILQYYAEPIREKIKNMNTKYAMVVAIVTIAIRQHFSRPLSRVIFPAPRELRG
jgi:ArsR family transcriptional regulator